MPGGVSTPILDVTSALGQALASCDKDVAVQDSSRAALPKGRANTRFAANFADFFDLAAAFFRTWTSR